MSGAKKIQMDEVEKRAENIDPCDGKETYEKVDLQLLAQSERLHALVQEFMVQASVGAMSASVHESEGSHVSHAYERLAWKIACFQARHHEGHFRLWKKAGLADHLCKPEGAEHSELATHLIPPVPADAFKMGRVSLFSSGNTPYCFRTSGTTLGARGQHFFRTLETYNKGALLSASKALPSASKIYEDRGRAKFQSVWIFGPSPEEVPDSSLGHMNALFGSSYAILGASFFFLEQGHLNLERLLRVHASSSSSEPVLLLGASFSYVHLLDACAQRGIKKLSLPQESVVMHTGGFKGKSREVSKEELREQMALFFDIPVRHVIAEYGMTELSSQAWERTAAEPQAPLDVFFEPPWMHVLPVDPESLLPVPKGEVGIARIEDLANVDSAFAIVTHDLVRRVDTPLGEGVQLLGRKVGAEPRGCSLLIEELLLR